MEKLSNLINISTVIEKNLNDIGVNSKEELISIGTKEAFTKIKIKNSDVCLNMLYAIEGAIQNVRWHNLPQNKKDDLKYFFDSL